MSRHMLRIRQIAMGVDAESLPTVYGLDEGGQLWVLGELDVEHTMSDWHFVSDSPRINDESAYSFPRQIIHAFDSEKCVYGLDGTGTLWKLEHSEWVHVTDSPKK